MQNPCGCDKHGAYRISYIDLEKDDEARKAAFRESAVFNGPCTAALAAFAMGMLSASIVNPLLEAIAWVVALVASAALAVWATHLYWKRPASVPRKVYRTWEHPNEPGLAHDLFLAYRDLTLAVGDSTEYAPYRNAVSRRRGAEIQLVRDQLADMQAVRGPQHDRAAQVLEAKRDEVRERADRAKRVGEDLGELEMIQREEQAAMRIDERSSRLQADMDARRALDDDPFKTAAEQQVLAAIAGAEPSAAAQAAAPEVGVPQASTG